MKKIIFISLLMSCLTVSPGQTQQPTAPEKGSMVLTLPEALKIAGERNIDMILGEERVKQAVARIRQNRAALYPQFTSGVSQSRMTKDLSTVGIDTGAGVVGPFNVFDARVKFTQTIFDLNTIERLKSAKAADKLSRAQQAQARQDVLALTAVLFIDAKRLTQSMDFLQTVVNRDERNVNIARKQFELGSGSELNVKESEAVLAQSKAALQTVKTQAVERKLDLLAALGIAPETPVALHWDTDQETLADRLGREQNNSIEDHPQVSVAREVLNVSARNEAAEKAGYLPKISLMADYGLSADSPQDSSTTYMLGVQATMPIFEGGSRGAKIEEAASQVRADKARLEDAKIQVQASILGEQAMIEQARAILGQREAELAAAEKNLEFTRVRKDTGFGNEQDLTAAEARMAFSEDQKEEAIAALITARINLLHARGEIDQTFFMEKE